MIPDSLTLDAAHYYYLNDQTIRDGKQKMEGPPKVVLSATGIKIGCAFITIDAAKFLLERHEKHFKVPPTEINLQ